MGLVFLMATKQGTIRREAGFHMRLELCMTRNFPTSQCRMRSQRQTDHQLDITIGIYDNVEFIGVYC